MTAPGWTTPRLTRELEAGAKAEPEGTAGSRSPRHPSRRRWELRAKAGLVAKAGERERRERRGLQERRERRERRGLRELRELRAKAERLGLRAKAERLGLRAKAELRELRARGAKG